MKTEWDYMVELLGNKSFPAGKPRNRYELVLMSRKGVSKRMLNDLINKLSISVKEFADALSITERTIQRYNEDQAFKTDVSEKILEITELYAKGFEVFEDEGAFKKWMDMSNIALGNIRPKSLLDTSMGIQMIHDELLKIEHGVLS